MVKIQSQKPNRAEATGARRRLIVETAAMCFIEKGFHLTSIRDIANRAKISLGNVYNHFESKADLIAEIATLEAEELSELHAKIAKIDNPVKALDKFTSLYFSYCCQPENSMLSAEIIAECLRNSEIGAGFHANRETLVKNLSSLINEARPQQSRARALSSGEAAEFMLDLIEGLAMRSAFLAKKPGAKAVRSLKAAIHAITADQV